MKNLLNKNLIILDSNAQSKIEILNEMIDKLYLEGKLNNKEEFKKEILSREKQSSTALGEGIAIPHAKTKAVKVPAIVFARTKKEIDFESDEGKCNIFFMIAATENTKDNHIETLSKLTTLLLDNNIKEKLLSAKNSDEIVNIFTIKNEDKVKEKLKLDKYILAVTACPVGVAHTYMAAEALTNKAKEMGVNIKVETNGSVGVKNKLTHDEIKKAECIIVAVDKNVDMERFSGKKVIQVSVKKAIKSPEELIKKALNGEGEIYISTKGGFTVKKDNEKKGIYKHLMNGVSHMLPLVVVGGVLIALSIALSGIKAGTGADVTNPFLKEILNIGVQAFGMMVPILAGYIAFSIADRPGLAPGLIGGGNSKYYWSRISWWNSSRIFSRICSKMDKILENPRTINATYANIYNSNSKFINCWIFNACNRNSYKRDNGIFN
jgi:PTS system fructose-specific IIC component